MIKRIREYLFNATSSVVPGLVAGTLGGAVGGAVLGLVLVIVANEGLTAYFALFMALIGGAIGVPIGAITGMLKAVVCRATATKVVWIVVSGLGAGLGARLFYGYDDIAILIVFTVLGVLIATAVVQFLTLPFCRETEEEATAKMMIYNSIALLMAGFLLVAPAVYAVLDLLDRLLFSLID